MMAQPLIAAAQAALGDFEAAVKTAFEEYSVWVTTHATNTLKTALVNEYVFKEPDNVRPRVSNWTEKKWFEDKKYAFLPVMPLIGEEDPELKRFYADMYTIVIAKDSPSADDTNRSLSYSAMKWAIYHQRVAKPFMDYLRYFLLAVDSAPANGTATTLSKAQLSEAVWNRFIAPFRLFLNHIWEHEGLYDAHAAGSLMNSLFYCETIQKDLLSKITPASWMSETKTFFAKSKQKTLPEELKKHEATAVLVKNIVSRAGAAPTTGSLLDLAFVRMNPGPLENVFVRDLFSAKAGLDAFIQRSKPPRTQSAEKKAQFVKEAEKALVDFEREYYAKIAKLKKDLESYRKTPVVEESAMVIETQASAKRSREQEVINLVEESSSALAAAETAEAKGESPVVVNALLIASREAESKAQELDTQARKTKKTDQGKTPTAAHPKFKKKVGCEACGGKKNGVHSCGL